MNTAILKGIGFENFRVFKQKTLLDFARLTILTGTNSSGKSSVINGLKLIGESFKDIKVSNKPEGFELQSLFKVSFNASEMMKRYGTLEKYINHFGREIGKNSFVFSIPTRLKNTREDVTIHFTIQVENNEQKNGKLRKIDMSLKSKDQSLLIIEKTPDAYIVKIDLSFFFSVYVQGLEWILKEYDTEEIESKRSLLNAGKFYDLSFLWAEDPADEKLFELAIRKFYGEYDANSLKKLCSDMVNKLSSIQWEADQLDYIIYLKDKQFPILSFKDKIGLSLLDAALRYYEKGGGKSVPNESRSIASLRQKTGFEKLAWDEIESLNDNNDFVEYLFNMIANKQSYYGKLWTNPDKEPFFKSEERAKTEIKSFEPNKAERYFYESFLFPNLDLIKEVFLPFETMKAVSTERSNSKGVKSMLDSDDFSRLMQKRFSATGLDKEAFNSLDEFLNKWLQEFKVADEIKFEKDEDYDVFKVRLLKNGRWMMLSDEGFGVSQVLPAILACCPIIGLNYEDNPFEPDKEYGYKLILIEEPETNLHPALQSKLADMFMDAIKTFNIRFIIETHSEYLVRKLQYLTGKGDIKPEDTVIYYFYPPTEVPDGEQQVKKINIQKDGSLTDDFGTGFFDEADNIALELFLLKQSQKN